MFEKSGLSTATTPRRATACFGAVLLAGLAVGCSGGRGVTPANASRPIPPSGGESVASTHRAPDASPATAPQADPSPAAMPGVGRDPAVAAIKAAGVEIPMSALQKPLLEAYGLNVLLNVVQRELARAQAKAQNLSLTADDLANERQWTFKGLFGEDQPGDYDKLLDNLLQRKNITRTEFELTIETNAYLRKLAEPQVANIITDDALRQSFAAQYGEKVRVRHMSLPNAEAVAKAKARLAAGENFAEVARTMSGNSRTAALGGALPPFTQNAVELPQNFRDVAFSLKVGQVSDPVEADGAYQLILLEERVANRVVRYDDVKDALREQLHERLLQESIKLLRQKNAGAAFQALDIFEPTLKRQLAERIAQQNGRQPEATPSSDAPATSPAPTTRSARDAAAADLRARVNAIHVERGLAPATGPVTTPAAPESP